MVDHGYLRCRSVAEAHAVDAYIQATAARVRPVPSMGELERERETLRLRAEFAKIDIRVMDSYSLSGCRRDAPEGS